MKDRHSYLPYVKRTASILCAARKARPAFLLILGLLILLAGSLILESNTAAAQSSGPHVPTDDEVNAIAKQLYCPVCENIPLDVCPTAACQQWRDMIRDLLSQGKTEAEIKQIFAAQYCDRVLAAPPARGLNWLVYIIPPIAILAGVFILFRAFRAWKQPALKEQPSSPTEISQDEYLRRLEEELERRA